MVQNIGVNIEKTNKQTNNVIPCVTLASGDCKVHTGTSFFLFFFWCFSFCLSFLVFILYMDFYYGRALVFLDQRLGATFIVKVQS